MGFFIFEIHKLNMLLKQSKQKTSEMRKPRLLWANFYCLMDTSSGASMCVREMLLQLMANGYDVEVLGATVFDNPKGNTKLSSKWDEIQKEVISIIKDGPLRHHLVVTKSTRRDEMTCKEENTWYSYYRGLLSEYKPDVVFYYGGQALDILLAAEAKLLNIPVVALLVNGNYSGKNWCRHVDLIVTDSKATAQRYKDKDGLDMTAVGTFINPRSVVALSHERQRVLFVNPSLQKGVAIVIMIAMAMEKIRPDIIFEVVESRGNWQAILEKFTMAIGDPRSKLDNVIVTANTSDMRPVYGRARVLLAPSLWWESGARVLAEAMLNGIPAICSQFGGSPEMIGDGGIIIQMPESTHKSFHNTIPSWSSINLIVERIIKFYDDKAYYEKYSARAKAVGASRHNIKLNGQKLKEVIDMVIGSNEKKA